jgi:phosphoribosyl-AMP cyclohydrolase
METFINDLNWNSSKNLIIDGISLLPTIVKDSDGTILGLVYSSRESLTLAMKEGIGAYHSRERGLWIKSPTRVNGQKLLQVEPDCDKDSLIFIVKQYGVFCHIGNRLCFTCHPSIQVCQFNNKLTIGYTYGRSESDIMNLFGNIGINIF